MTDSEDLDGKLANSGSKECSIGHAAKQGIGNHTMEIVSVYIEFQTFMITIPIIALCLLLKTL